MALSELTDPNAVRRAIEEFKGLGRTAFLSRYGFGRAREYMVLGTGGEHYDSKAIVGAAFGFQYPDRGPMAPGDFTGGEQTVERKLNDLGFEVVRVGENWTREEVRLAVHDYFDMLQAESKNLPFSKAEHNQRLREQLRGRRSKGSVELKHQNISAMLDELDLPYIKGYKPRSNAQAELRDVVRETVNQRRNELLQVMDDFEAIRTPSAPNFSAALVEVPAGLPYVPKPRTRLPRKLDFAARDEKNRTLGRSGEEWTLGFEGHRLTMDDRAHLVPHIQWVSDEHGDGAGYDILSFEGDGSNRYVEVKTTNGNALTPFLVSSNELEFSREAGRAFCLYRVFEFSALPQVFILRGDLSATATLTPTDYRARLKAI